jgi:hypothetical protein
VVEGGELWAQKWCESKPPLTDPQSRAYIMINPRVVNGRPLGIKPRPDPKERSFKERRNGS